MKEKKPTEDLGEDILPEMWPESELGLGRPEIFWKPLNGDQKMVLESTQECEMRPASPYKMEGHKPSVSLGSIDAVNLI